MGDVVTRILRGAALVFLGATFGAFLSFLWRTILARAFLPSDYGLFILALTIVNFFSIIGLLGLPEGAVRQIAAHKRKKKHFIASALFISTISGLLAFLACYLTSDILESFFDAPGLSGLLKVMAFGIPFSVFSTIVAAVLRAEEQFGKATFLRNVFPNLLLVSFISLSVFLLGWDTKGAAAIYVISWAINAVVAFVFARKTEFEKPLLVFDLLLFSAPLLFSQIVFFLNQWLDTLMIGYFLTPYEVGVYNAAVLLAILPSFFLNSFGQAYLPVASSSGRNKLAEVYSRTTLLVFASTFPIATVLILFPSTAVDFTFGKAYEMAAYPLVFLAAGRLVGAFFGPNGRTLTAMGKPQYVLRATMASVFTNLVLNLLLIPVFGIVGGAVSTFVAQLVFNVSASVFLYAKYKIRPPMFGYKKALFVSVALFTIFFLLKLISGESFYWAVIYMILGYIFAFRAKE